jgi:hypothetical protein
MAFALTIVQIEEALKQPGCAICRLSEAAVRKSAEVFLYENSMNPQVREPIVKSRGFCPEHTRLLAAIELSADGSALGMNYIYEQLARVVAAELDDFRPTGKSARRLLRKRPSPLPACPLCELGAGSAADYLSALFEELESEGSRTRPIYTHSNGLCYHHLRSGLEHSGAAFPNAAAFLVEDTRGHLLERAGEMQEYIRKHDWHYRDEKVTPAESTAWQAALSFFTGLPPDSFTHKFEKKA